MPGYSHSGLIHFSGLCHIPLSAGDLMLAPHQRAKSGMKNLEPGASHLAVSPAFSCLACSQYSTLASCDCEMAHLAPCALETTSHGMLSQGVPLKRSPNASLALRQTPPTANHSEGRGMQRVLYPHCNFFSSIQRWHSTHVLSFVLAGPRFEGSKRRLPWSCISCVCVSCRFSCGDKQTLHSG